MDKTGLQEAINTYNRQLNRLRKTFGIKVPNSFILKIVEMAESAPHGQFLLIPKYALDDILSNYKRVLPDYSKFPCHILHGDDLFCQIKVHFYWSSISGSG